MTEIRMQDNEPGSCDAKNTINTFSSSVTSVDSSDTKMP